MIEGIEGEVNSIVAGVTEFGEGAIGVVSSEEFTSLSNEYAEVEALANQLADRIGALAARTMERRAMLEPYAEGNRTTDELFGRMLDVAEGTAEGGPLDKAADRILSVERVVEKLTNGLPRTNELLLEEAKAAREIGKVIGAWGASINDQINIVKTGVPRRLDAIGRLVEEWRATS